MARSLMSQAKKKNYGDDEAEKPASVQHPPKVCQTQGCDGEVKHLMARVASGRGIQHKPASDVMTSTRVGGQLFLSMNGDYQFAGWFARCPECYKQAFERGRAKLRMEGEHRFYV